MAKNMKLTEQQALLTASFRMAFPEEFADSSPRNDAGEHPAADLEFLDRLDNNLLSESERADFVRHLQQCDFCRHEIGYFVRHGILYTDTENALESDKKPLEKKRFFRTVPGILYFMTAALSVMIFGASLLFQEGNGRKARLARRELSAVLTQDDRAYSNRISDYGYALTGETFHISFKGLDDPAEEDTAPVDEHALSAEQAYQNAIAAAPGDAALRLDYARYQLFVLEQPEKAYETLKGVIDAPSAKNRADLLMAFGIAAFQIGGGKNLDEAIKAFRQVLELDPDSIDARLNLAAVLYRCNKSDEALKLFESVRDVPNLDPELKEEIDSTIEMLGQANSIDTL